MAALLCTSKLKLLLNFIIARVIGETEELGKFTIKFPSENNGKKCVFHSVSTKLEGLHRIKDTALRKMQVSSEGSREKPKMLYYLKDTAANIDPPNLKSDIAFHQVCTARTFYAIFSLIA